MVDRVRQIESKPPQPSGPGRDGCITLVWDYEECTDRMASAFARMSRAVAGAGAKEVVLDMSKCTYLSISGMRALLEWHRELAREGIEMRVSGLEPIPAQIVVMSKLEWILLDREPDGRKR